MDLATIISQLKNERERINKAIAALDGTSSVGAESVPGENSGRSKRRISAAGRRRISEMMKKRWAERRKKAGAKSK